MKYRVKHVAEYVLMRILILPIRLLPYRLALSVGWILAWIGHRLMRFRVAEAKRRIREVFGDRFSSSEVDTIAWLAWRNFIFSVVDMIRLSGVTRDWIKTHLVNYEDVLRSVDSTLKTGKGAIFAAPHMGSSELAGVTMQLMGVPVFFITGKQKNPLVDAYINTLRGSTGISTIARGSSLLKNVIKRLRAGEVLGFQPDVRSATEGIKVNFLGKEANVVGGMALFSRQTETPIVLIAARRLDWTRHSYRFFPPVRHDASVEKEADWKRITQQVFTMIEEEIRSSPEQWFWYNKRWILDPLEPAQVKQMANGR